MSVLPKGPNPILTATGAVRAGWTGVIVVVAMFLAIGLSVGFTLNQRAEDNHTWCELLPVLDTPVPTPSDGASPGPLNQREQQITRAIHDIRVSKCGGGK